MNVALLFNSDHTSLGGYYGPPVMDRILGAGVVQKTNRYMRVSIGDILTYGAASASETPTVAFLVELCRKAYQPRVFDQIIRDRLEVTHGKCTVFCWLFQNMTATVANALHKKLVPDPAYLGAMDVEFSDPIHLWLFRNSLCERYRFYGPRCSVFYVMGENEDPDDVILAAFEKHGFTVSYEDIGARRTIIDSYDTLDHFKRIGDFERVFSGFDNLSVDCLSDVVCSLEELHPRLFDVFASAARGFERAETQEDYAQVALSGRRLLEKFADYLFPPRDEEWKGRKVGRSQYKNRLWAYIEQVIAGSVNADGCALTRLGKEADRLVDLFNAGLHADPTREKVESSFIDLMLWLSEVIELDPAAARKPYLAYEQELIKRC